MSRPVSNLFKIRKTAVKKMWSFKPGWLGITIVIISLLGGMLGASLLNVDSNSVASTDYNYKTDITGLFSTSNVPQYTDYNPISNYTGFTNPNPTTYPANPSALTFTQTGVANNYRMLLSAGSPHLGPSGTVNDNSVYTQTALNDPHFNAPSADRVHGVNAWTATVRDFKVTSMYNWAVSVFGDLANYSAISLSITMPADSAPTEKGLFMAWGLEIDNSYFLSSYPNGTYTINPGDLTITDTYIYNGNTFSKTFSLYDVFILYGDAVQTETYASGGDMHLATYNTSLSFSYTSTVTPPATYAYMVPSNGLTNAYIVPVNSLDTSYATIWDNDTVSTDYDNQVINILVGPNFNNGTYTLGDRSTCLVITNGISNITITYGNDHLGAGSGKWGVLVDTLTYGGTYLEQDTIGTFPAVMLSLSNGDGNTILDIYGVTDFNSYTDVTVSPIVSASYDLEQVASLDSLTILSTATNSTIGTVGALSFSVYSTKIFMNTYDVVLSNPSIDLADYWADMDSYRYAFQSFALYGDSITINGVTYPVTDQTITINGRAYVLDNFYLSYSKQGDTSITFKNINRTLDLGPTVNKTVSFAGNWYFTTGLYEGVQSVKEVYDWSPELLADGLNTVILVALGLMVVLALVCIGLRVSLKLSDKVVMGGGALILVLMLVV